MTLGSWVSLVLLIIALFLFKRSPKQGLTFLKYVALIAIGAFLGLAFDVVVRIFSYPPIILGGLTGLLMARYANGWFTLKPSPREAAWFSGAPSKHWKRWVWVMTVPLLLVALLPLIKEFNATGRVIDWSNSTETTSLLCFVALLLLVGWRTYDGE